MVAVPSLVSGLSEVCTPCVLIEKATKIFLKVTDALKHSSQNRATDEIGSATVIH